jgi:hypothetical protein
VRPEGREAQDQHHQHRHHHQAPARPQPPGHADVYRKGAEPHTSTEATGRRSDRGSVGPRPKRTTRSGRRTVSPSASAKGGRVIAVEQGAVPWSRRLDGRMPGGPCAVRHGAAAPATLPPCGHGLRCRVSAARTAGRPAPAG